MFKRIQYCGESNNCITEFSALRSNDSLAGIIPMTLGRSYDASFLCAVSLQKLYLSVHYFLNKVSYGKKRFRIVHENFKTHVKLKIFQFTYRNIASINKRNIFHILWTMCPSSLLSSARWDTGYVRKVMVTYRPLLSVKFTKIQVSTLMILLQ